MSRDDAEFELLKRLVEQKDRELESVFDLLADGIGKFACNDEFTILYYNDGLIDLVGIDRGEVEANGFNSSIYIHHEDYPRAQAVTLKAIETGEPFTLVYRLVHADGHPIWVKANGLVTEELFQNRYPIMYVFYTDVTDVVEANERLRIQVERQRVLMDLTGEMFVEYDHAADELTMLGDFSSYYQGPSRIKPLSAYLTEHPDRAHATGLADLYDILTKSDLEGVVERRLPRADGRLSWFSIQGRKIYGEDGSLQKSICRIIDIDDEKREREQLMRRASTDDLTGAYSLGAAISLIGDRLRHAEARGTSVFMIVDIDRFKEINDSFGHPSGDKVLTESVALVRNLLRDRDIIGRIGGDEFCVFIEGLGGAEEAEAIAQRICRLFPLASTDLVDRRVTCSIGMTTCAGGDKAYEQLYEEADQALYRAKEQGRNGYAFYGEASAEA